MIVIGVFVILEQLHTLLNAREFFGDDGIEQGLTPCCGGCIVLHTATQGSFQKLSYDR